MEKNLSCHLHDYIEIACLYGFEIRLQLDKQKVVEGKAVTTEISSDKTEHILMLVDGQNIKIDLTEILSMQAVTQNPHFSLVEFR